MKIIMNKMMIMMIDMKFHINYISDCQDLSDTLGNGKKSL